MSTFARPFVRGTLALALLIGPAALAVERLAPLIVESPDDNQRVTLPGNTRPEALPENDLGPVDDGLLLDHLQLQLRRSPEQERAVADFVDALHDPGSPEFHHWVTAAEFGQRFGIAGEDIDVVTAWLTSHGFTVNTVYAGRMMLDLRGTAGQVREAFGTELHHLRVNGVAHIANMSDPSIPQALAPVVAGIVSLHDFRPAANLVMRSNYTESSTEHLLVPADVATIYNLGPAYTAGFTGKNETIALIEDSDLYQDSDWSTFRAKFGLSSYSSGSFSTVHPDNCEDPGVSGADIEAALDVEWSSAAAPNAAIQLVSCADTATSFGGLIAIQNLINGTKLPQIMSLSYGECEAYIGVTGNQSFNAAYQQAAAEGISVFVSSGDAGAVGCFHPYNSVDGIDVNGWGSTPYNVSVGGTDFADTYARTTSTYWGATNGATYGSALSYIPEIPWNDSCAGELLSSYNGFSTPYGSSGFCNSTKGGNYITCGAASGGPSSCATGTPTITGGDGLPVVSGTCAGYSKPSWQSVLGNPADGKRDLPDVSLFAADGVWGHCMVFCSSDYAACTGAPSTWGCAGGTSFASPTMAGIQALVDQKWGKQGNPNPVYYSMASTEYGSSGNSTCNSTLGKTINASCTFHDVTLGDNDVNCSGPYDCYDPSGTYGVMSVSSTSDKPSYAATTGWDFATGLGTVNATNLVNNTRWGGVTTGNFSLTLSATSLTVQQNASGSITVTTAVTTAPSQQVSLTASGLPPGATASFSPASLTAGASSTVTIDAGSASAGTYDVTITGTGTTVTHTVALTLSITGAGSFSLSLSESSLSVVEGQTGSLTVRSTTTSGSAELITLAATGMPAGGSATFNPASIESGSSATLTFSAGSAAAGTYAIVVKGAGSTTSQTATLELTVTAPGFSIAVTSPAESMTRNTSVQDSITTAITSGLSETVALSVSGVPTGATATLAQPNVFSGNGTTLTISSGSAAFGSYMLTVKGTNGSTSHTATIALTIHD